MATKVKQIIVIRKQYPDGNGGFKKLRRGKEIAQGAHASLGGLLQLMNVEDEDKDFLYTLQFNNKSPLHFWLYEKFKKVCLSVDSEQELMDIYLKAVKAKLNVCLITDAGDTEFNGVPTKTCLSIGPDFDEKIDPITGHLKLY